MRFIFTFAIFVSVSVSVKSQTTSFDKITRWPSESVFAAMTGCTNGDFITTYSSTETSPDAFAAARYDSIGELIWFLEFLNPSFLSMGASDVIEASNGDILISTSALTSNNTLCVGLFRINSQGTLLWERLYSSGGLPGFKLGGNSKLVEANDGSIYLGTNERDPSFIESMVLLRFSASGNLLWGRTFGTTPWQTLRTLSEGPAAGVHIGAQNNPGNTIHLITVDSSGALINAKECAQWGFLADFLTDSAKNIKALLTRNGTSASRLIELDSAGNIAVARWSPFSTQPFANALFSYGGGYVSVHGNNTFGTRLCNWYASPSLSNGINYTDSTRFTGYGFFQIGDGSIYIAGRHDNNDSVTRVVKTNPMTGTDFQYNGCGQVNGNYTLFTLSLSNPTPLSLNISPYTPVTELSALTSQFLSGTVADNCTGVSVSEILTNRFDLYPNPSSDQINITGNFTGIVLVEVLSVAGQVIVNTQMQPEGNRVQLSTTQLPEGVYVLRITDRTSASALRRFVVSR